MTDTGYETIKRNYQTNPRIEFLLFPLDDFFGIKKLLKKIQLNRLIIIETEIWPNLISLTSKRAPVILINGRISNKSIKSYARMRFFLRPLLEKIQLFVMQSEKDRKRITFLGAKKERVFNLGNLKFDIELEQFTPEELKELRERILPYSQDFFVAGSTRDDEEEYILEAFDSLEDTLLILVPRHIERVPDICNRLLKGYDSITWKEFQQGASFSKDKRKKVLIVNEMGILRKLYAISDIAYVGGTLVNIGGHSLLEPLFYRKTPIFGPYLQNVKDISKEILSRGIGFKVETSFELSETIKKISNSNKVDHCEKEIKLIEQFFKENRNSAQLTFDKIFN